jgi:hypothetical protein
VALVLCFSVFAERVCYMGCDVLGAGACLHR